MSSDLAAGQPLVCWPDGAVRGAPHVEHADMLLADVDYPFY